MEFQKSSFCAAAECVEVAQEPHSVILRDRTGDTVQYDLEEWRVFVLGVKAGEFDR